MQTGRSVRLGKVACAATVVPVLIWAYAGGPPAGYTGAPGEPTCTACHVGAVNPAGGRVEILFPDTSSGYTPGAKLRVQVRITDSSAQGYGFQLTARLSNGSRAGSFSSLDASTAVLCEDGSLRPASGVCSGPFREYIEHTRMSSSNTFTVEWVAPAAGAGGVTFFAAANGANANGANTGDHIYTTNVQLAEAVSAPPKPAIRSDQPVLQAFSGQPKLSSGTWLEIYGANFSLVTREWTGNDFQESRAPTELEGVRVNINGKAAFVRYVSPTQVNVQAPDDDAVGPVPVEVLNRNGTSNTVTVQKVKVSPALLTTPAFQVGGKQYAAALHADFKTFVGPVNFIAGVPSRPAQPGETIILFAVGCGATNPPTPAGQYFPEARPLASPVRVTFGETVAETRGFLAAGAVGLCQLNVTVPTVADGDVRIDAAVDGVTTGQILYTTIQR